MGKARGFPTLPLVCKKNEKERRICQLVPGKKASGFKPGARLVWPEKNLQKGVKKRRKWVKKHVVNSSSTKRENSIVLAVKLWEKKVVRKVYAIVYFVSGLNQMGEN